MTQLFYYLIKSPMRDKLYLTITKIISIILFWVLLIKPDLAYQCMIWKQFIIVKIVLLIFSIMFIDQYMEYILVIYKKIKERSKKISFEKTIDWVKTRDLVDFIFQCNWFPANEFLDTFHVSKDVYKKLGDNLERIWVLTRWSKNARIIWSLYGIDDVYTILEKINDSSTLSTPLVQTGPTSYSFASHSLLTGEN